MRSRAATAPRGLDRLVGPGRALEVARLVTADVRGFASMELGDGFGLGGDVDAAFAYGVETLVSALERAEAVEAGRVARVAEEPVARSPGRMPDA